MRIFLMCLLTGTAALAADAPCDPPEDIEDRIRPGAVLVFGEMHGTEQSPAFVGSVACAAAARDFEVVVGLELDGATQAQVDRYLASNGGPDDRAALLDHPIWTREYQDGRNSEAMVALIERMRALRAAGNKVRMLMFDAPSVKTRDAAMARNVAKSVERSPEAVHVLLAGNLHSRIKRGNRWDPEFEPMAYHLRKELGDRLLTLDVGYEDGTAWVCTPDCGVTNLRGRAGGEPGTVVIDDETGSSAHAGRYFVGTISASLPAVGEHDVPEPPPPPAAPAPDPPAAKRETVNDDSPHVAKLQGRWQAWQNGNRIWTIEFDGRSFDALMGRDEWYRGQVFVRPRDDLSEIDFLIEDCNCGYQDESSDGVYVWEGDVMILAAPQPGMARPGYIDERKGEVVRLVRIADESTGTP